MSGEKPRQIAAQVLQQRQADGGFIENVLEKTLSHSRLAAADRGLCQELVYGVVRWQAALDWLIARKTGGSSPHRLDATAPRRGQSGSVRATGHTQKPMLQNLLRLGLYQIFWLDRIPDHAAVHETVELAKHNGFGAQAGFVNAVLRGYLREFDATRQLLAELKTTQPALGCSHPEWLIARWQTRWGREKTARLMEWNNTPPKIYARVNTLKADPGKLLEQWREENVEYDFVRRDWLEENLMFELKSHSALAQLPSFQQGLFYVQDPSTLLAARELDPQPGETLLDLCAAPGGKATYLAQLIRNDGRLLAYDTSPERLKWVEENCARLGVTCVQTALPSTCNLQPATFDRILVDAPCSNTGVMRRRVDLRWRICPGEIERLQAAQLDLLERAASLLKPGGTLVYSTCSLEPEENQQAVGQFLRRHARFKLERERELLPFVDEVDGAYVARLLLSVS